jgi:hypothetical protein
VLPPFVVFVPHGSRQFHQIQAQVAVADVVGGPNLEMIVADMGGNLAVVDFDGEVRSQQREREERERRGRGEREREREREREI